MAGTIPTDSSAEMRILAMAVCLSTNADYRGFPEPQGLGFQRGILKEEFQFDHALLFYGVEYKLEFSMLSAFGTGAFLAGFLCKP